MAMLTERISAADAYEWGMISHLVDDDAFDTEVDAVVGKLDSLSGPSLKWIKRALRAGTMITLTEVQAIELDGQYALIKTPEFRSAVASFRVSATDRRSM
jgi:enoyl-CoA hydratase